MLRSAAWAILLLASVVVSPAQAAGQTEQLYFVEHESERRATGVLDEGETRAFSFAVDEPNLTRVDFLLTWTETGDPTGLTRLDALSLSVVGPDGRADARGPLATGSAHVRVPVSTLPETQTVPVRDAPARLADLVTHEGTGDWVARVRLADAGNPVGLAKLDTQNAFELLVVLTTYEAVPSLLVPQVGTASAPLPASSLWGMATFGLALLVLAVTVVLLRPVWGRLLPRRDNTPSLAAGQPGALPPGDDPSYIPLHRD